MRNELWVDNTGTSVEGVLGEYNGVGGFAIYTNDESLEAKHSTYLRGCSSQGELLELALNLEIIKNTKP